MPKRELKGKTKAAEKKSSARGPDIDDIDIHAYSTKAKVHEKVKKLRHLSDEVKDKSLHVGIDTGEACRSGSFFQIDHSVILASAYQEGIEVMSSSEALKRYD
ncbi:MAG: SufD family Fe-S cluster assembly protein, partial [Thermodesulfovibrionia bacterium]|nr:SufD family Fe-S cluster assembly protein [Thermodesulfovibrionia bacterium]